MAGIYLVMPVKPMVGWFTAFWICIRKRFWYYFRIRHFFCIGEFLVSNLSYNKPFDWNRWVNIRIHWDDIRLEDQIMFSSNLVWSSLVMFEEFVPRLLLELEKGNRWDGRTSKHLVDDSLLGKDGKCHGNSWRKCHDMNKTTWIYRELHFTWKNPSTFREVRSQWGKFSKKFFTKCVTRVHL